jgi:hypothetical protein
MLDLEQQTLLLHCDSSFNLSYAVQFTLQNSPAVLMMTALKPAPALSQTSKS